jgi:hypothetical protein
MAETTKRKWTLWEVVAVLLVFPLVPLFHYIGKPASGFPAALSVLVIAIAIRVRWELSRLPWFWIAVFAIAVIHVPIIWFVPWSTRWIPAFIITPFCIVDLLAILGIFTLVERLNGSVSASEEISSSDERKSL